MVKEGACLTVELTRELELRKRGRKHEWDWGDIGLSEIETFEGRRAANRSIVVDFDVEYELTYLHHLY